MNLKINDCLFITFIWLSCFFNRFRFKCLQFETALHAKCAMEMQCMYVNGTERTSCKQVDPADTTL